MKKYFTSLLILICLCSTMLMGTALKIKASPLRCFDETCNLKYITPPSVNVMRSESGLHSLHWSPDGKWLVFIGTSSCSDQEPYYIWKVRADGTELTKLLKCEPPHFLIGPYSQGENKYFFNSFQIRWSFDGENIYFCDGKFIYSIKPDGTNLKKIVKGRYFEILPSGKEMMYIEQQNAKEIYFINLENSSKKFVALDRGIQDVNLTLSPDGMYIAFSAMIKDEELKAKLIRHGAAPPEYHIFIMPANGGTPRLVYTDIFREIMLRRTQEMAGTPSWAPNSKWVAFVTHFIGDTSYPTDWIEIADLAGEQLARFPMLCDVIWPIWSPDSAKIAFEASIYAQRTVGLINLKTRSICYLNSPSYGSPLDNIVAKSEFGSCAPAFSPDGKMLVCILIDNKKFNGRLAIVTLKE